MAMAKPSKERVQAVVDRWQVLGGAAQCTMTRLAKELGMSRETVRTWIQNLVPFYGIDLSKTQEVTASVPLPEAAAKEVELAHTISTLKAQLSAYQKDELNTRYVRTKIMGLAEATPTPPTWLIDVGTTGSSPGVPSLMCSDWHWGEVIASSQVGGVNSYSLEIAHERAKRLIQVTIDLLNNHMVNPDYPGFVLLLGGDMVSGDIHDELKETNDIPLIPAVVDLFGVLIWCIETLATAFGRVFVPCVTGNHGRNTQKIRHKDRAYTSFDWMLYVLLEKHFKGDARVTFLIPDGPDAYYKIFSHRYLLTHGDQFRGGDGMIGALGPIIRGDHKKRSRNNQIDMGYDTLLLGHWHQLIQMQRLIVNGSLCGYNEYAYSGNFPFETPKQALWITHPSHGITFSMPVHVSTPSERTETPWVSVK